MSSTFWPSLYRQWLWIAPPLMVITLASLGLFIPGLVTLQKKSHLFRVPLAETQEVQFAKAERVSLSIEGPRGTSRFDKVDFELRGSGGEAVEGRTVWFRTRSSGISTARTELLRYDIPKAGRYVLRMKGLGGVQEGDAGHAVVFSRPVMLPTAGYVVGIVLAAGVFIASLVFLLLRMRKPGSPA